MTNAFTGFDTGLLLLVAALFRISNAQSDADTYLGCYEDIGILDTFVHRYWSQNMAPDRCREFCRSQSFTLAGLLAGENCSCTDQNQLDTSILKRLSESRCDMSCVGDRHKVCGGTKDSDVYSIYSSCPKGKWGSKDCSRNCNCKDDGRCSIHGACPNNKCAPGWKLISINNRVTCTSDVDECEAECSSTNTTQCHNCRSVDGSVCKNTAGSFHCLCTTGFIKENEKCIDVDECALGQSGCNQKCVNTIGSYRCICRTGYSLNGIYTCIDINECERNNGGCSHLCVNTDGSYRCSCRMGYELDSNTHRCRDIDECSLAQPTCNQRCTNSIGSYNCSCFDGYELRNNFNCIDINECAIENGGCRFYCKNTPGSFECSCPPGYKVVGNSTKDQYCTDIDECVTGEHECDHECTNIIGAYYCSCNSGFVLVDRFTCQNDATSYKIGSGIGLGIQAIIIVILAMMLLKRRTSQGRDKSTTVENFDIKEYASLAVAVHKSEGVYTAIRNLSSDDYKNYEPTYNIVSDST